MAELIREDPGFDVNMAVDEYGVAVLHVACYRDSRSAVIPLLLAHPDMEVNVKTEDGCTPFSIACSNGSTSCVREMLKDFRVKVNEPRNNGTTSLWWAASFGHLDVMKWWIASGREMDLGKPGDISKTDVIGAARKKGKAEVVTLLERFKSDATQTKHAVRVELGLLDELAAEMFALVVFVSDGILQIKDTPPSPAARYFSIAAQLPLELQMVLCQLLGDQPGRSSQGERGRWHSRIWQGDPGDPHGAQMTGRPHFHHTMHPPLAIQ